MNGDAKHLVERHDAQRSYYELVLRQPVFIMAPRQDTDFNMDVDSDSDISIFGDGGDPARSKGKGKGKAPEKRRKGKEQRIVNEVSLNPSSLLCAPIYETGLTFFFLLKMSDSKPIRGRRRTLVRGMRYKKTRRGACRVPWMIGWREADGEGEGIHQPIWLIQLIFSPFVRIWRLLAPAAAIRRTIIRHLILLLDLSSSMTDRDMRPTRFDLSLQYAREFIAEWFDQNPLGQIGIVGMRAGVGERIAEMSGVSSFSWLPCDGACDDNRQAIHRKS